MGKPSLWFLGVCAAWWFLCLIFPLLAWFAAGAVLTLAHPSAVGFLYLFALLVCAAVAAIPVSNATIKARSQWRPRIVRMTVTALLTICFGAIAMGDFKWACRVGCLG
jgi:hypothetical protein